MHKPDRRTAVTWVLIGTVAILIAGVAYIMGSQQSRWVSQTAGQSDFGYTDGGRAATEEGLAVAPPDAKSSDTIQSRPSNSAANGESDSQVLVIRNSTIEIRVKSVEKSVQSLRDAVARFGAEITDLNVTAGDGEVPLLEGGTPVQRGPSSAYVTIRVPAERLVALEKEVAGLGIVLTQSSNAADVTEQAIDLQARLENLRAEEVRLRDFLKRTAKVSELLEVERELSRVRGEIESMDAQLTYLKRQAARATLTVMLTEPGPVVQPTGATWGFREAVTRGIQATAALVAVLITIAIPLLLIGVVVLMIAWPIRALLRRRAIKRGTIDGEE